MMRFQPLGIAGAASAWVLFCLAGCGDGGNFKTAEEVRQAGVPVAEEEHDHFHSAPHHGALSELGNHDAHVELVLDESTGEVTLYVLDGEAEKSLSTDQSEVVLKVTKTDAKDQAGVPFDLTLTYVAEKQAFVGTSELLKGAHDFVAEAAMIKAGEKTHEKVSLHFEADHDHGAHEHGEHGHAEHGTEGHGPEAAPAAGSTTP